MLPEIRYTVSRTPLRRGVLSIVLGLVALAVAGCDGEEPALEGTYWKLVELGGQAVPSPPGTRQPHLVFEGADQVSGFDGCNRVAGRATRSPGGEISFAGTVTTRMACPGASDLDRRFQDAMTRASRWAIAGGRLTLLDGGGARLAAFDGQPLPASPGGPAPR